MLTDFCITNYFKNMFTWKNTRLTWLIYPGEGLRYDIP